MADNPYEAPDTDLGYDNEVGDPQGVEAGRGMAWISEGWALFKAAPLIWVVIFVVMIIIAVVLAFIPFVGQLAMNLITPVLTAGLMAGCAAIDDGDELTIGHLFAGFQEKTGPLIGLGAMTMVMSLAVGIVVGILAAVFGVGMAGLASAGGNAGGIPGGETAALGGVIVIGLIAMALFIPVIMAIWFAPALIMLGDKGVFESLKMSFAGCLKNIIPFLVYGIVAGVLMIIAVIPVGLGLLVLVPVLYASMYTGYKDVYGV